MPVDFIIKLKPSSDKQSIKISEAFNKQNVVYKCGSCGDEPVQRIIEVAFRKTKPSSPHSVLVKVGKFNYPDHIEKVSQLILKQLKKIDSTIQFDIAV
jgi:hypothetical protein